MSKTTIILIAAGVALLSLTVGLIIFRKKKSSKALTPVRSSKQPEPELDAVLVEGLRTYALRFIGLYEGIYMAAENQNSVAMDAYTEWHIRLGNLAEDDAFRQHFINRFPKEDVQPEQLRELLQYFLAAGISRSCEQTHRAMPQTQERYIYMGNDELIVGKEYKVFQPCWLLDGITVQQGLLIPMEGL